MPTIIDGKAIADQFYSDIIHEIAELKKVHIHPKLGVILVGDNPASKMYVNMKRRKAEELGIEMSLIHLPQDSPEEEVEHNIEQFNNDSTVHAFLLQLPLPSHLNSRKLLRMIDPKKDVDGLHPANIGLLVKGGKIEEMNFSIPGTPMGIIELLDRSNISIEGKNAVVVGRSNLVGFPVATLLLHRNATVTICHSRTRELGHVTRQADILVVAVGRPHLIKENMVKEGAVVIDTGSGLLNGKLTGDVDFENVAPHCSAITPVPGGVGPMTIAMIFKNTVRLAKAYAASLDKTNLSSN
ncbi:MAG: bifunctional 5,10-methylenetetrahydrofolate dehydrogenase/5,10-methenyltetrahydrofolate cyclohydrolase [Candidatus Hermodarchaeota archaeon]